MAEKIPESHRDLIEGPIFVAFTTVMPDGQPQSSVVWCNYKEPYVLVNTARGRQKEENVRQNPKVTILAVDPEDPHRYLEVRGTVEEITEEGAVEHINELSQLYRGRPYYTSPDQQQKETRIIFKIRPMRVRSYG